MDFVHLHLHTQYSLADGAIIIGNLIPRVKSLGMKSVAITDHGYMYGAVDFYNACKEADIKPVLGCEAYISPNSRHERKYDEGDMKYYHLILLAENNKGFYNLSKLASIANTEGFYYKPRIDKEVLAQYSEGIIVLSACMSGEIPKKILSGNYKAAKEAALEYRDIMGDGNFFLEIQYNELPEQNIINTQLINISKETGIPLVATCDCHYLDRDDRESHDILRCIQHSELFDREKYQNDPPSSLYFKSAEEVSAYFRDCPEAVENTVKIAERCNVTIGSDRLHLPVYDVPAPHTPESYFRHLAEEGLNGHLKLVPPEKHEEYYKRLNMEMDVIEMKGYVGYYLIVWDFINYARRNGITVGPGRGSGAGSLAAYSLGITDIDPIKLNLLFERFLNPERSSPPDFDIDFCVRRRDEVFQYVREKYGKDNISQIVTFSRLSGRGVIRDVCRALAIPLATADRLAKAIPEVPGITLAEALKDDPSIENTIKAVDKGAELLKHSLKLEGLLRQAGTHPAGVVIADKPPDEYVPLCRGKNEEVQVQYEAEHIENLGLVKFDLLGLATLTIIDDAVKRVRHDIEPSFDISAIPFDDPKVYEMLANGESTGVFQLESSGMRSLMKRLRPSSLEDITALNALYRPGPIGSGMLDLFCDRKHGRQPVTYPLPQLKSILTETYGVILYQEQVMEIARVAAGYSLGAADILRKAMGKKKADVMQRQQAVFTDGDEKLGIPGARSLGITAEKAKEIFSLMEKFAEYGFNKSHSAAYAVLAYRTAYLRCNFPAQFLAAAMSSEEMSQNKLVVLIDDARRTGIVVSPPDINKSGLQFEYIDKAIRFGLQAVKNVGMAAAEALIAERVENGPYKSIYNLCKRMDLRKVNKRALEALIWAGAFDCFGKNRAQHLNVLENCLEAGQQKQRMMERGMQQKQRMKEYGIMSIEDFLFEREDDPEAPEDFLDVTEKTEEFYPDIMEMPDFELLSKEKSVLGMYFSSHPTMNAAAISGNAFDTAKAALNTASGMPVTMLGLVKSLKNTQTKKGKENMAMLVLEDHTGTVDAVVFPSAYKQFGAMLKKDAMIVAAGTWEVKGDRSSIDIKHIYTFEEGIEKLTKGLNVSLSLNDTKSEDIDKLYGIIKDNIGKMPLTLSVSQGSEYEFILPLASKFRIKPSEKFFRQMTECNCGFSCSVIIPEERTASSYIIEEVCEEDVL